MRVKPKIGFYERALTALLFAICAGLCFVFSELIAGKIGIVMFSILTVVFIRVSGEALKDERGLKK